MLQCYCKLFAPFHSHWWIQTGVTVRKHQIRVKIDDFFVRCDLEIWRMTSKNHRTPLLCHCKLCASFLSHAWIQTGVTVQKPIIGTKFVLISVTLTFDLWSWPYAGASLLSMVITPENFMMIRWQEHCEKGVTDGRTDVQTDGQTDGHRQRYYPPALVRWVKYHNNRRW